MQLIGLHFLLTYKCNVACDHCFVWGGPHQRGVLTADQIKLILQQAREVETIRTIYFEGGEPFLYYPTLVRGVQMASAMGFSVGIVTNAYWATTVDDAVLWLKPFVDLIDDLTVSSDLYHSEAPLMRKSANALKAAAQLGLPTGVISVAQPEEVNEMLAAGRVESGDADVMYRGRAAVMLTERVAKQPWNSFDACVNEDLRKPGRVHVDPFGNIHLCQGLVLGNVFENPLKTICDSYEPDEHPVAGPLLAGGPAALLSEYGLPHAEKYADACHLCYEARVMLRDRFPDILTPDQMYGR
jgi:MoaA/NifB/PqqE/SkfB family radical SAM enzyme